MISDFHLIINPLISQYKKISDLDLLRNKSEIKNLKSEILMLPDQDIVLIDDICDTARTLAKAAALIMERGARSVRAVCTHPVLSGDAYETIENSELAELIVTDTIPLKHTSPKITVLSTGELFAKAIINVNEHGSISQLFKI